MEELNRLSGEITRAAIKVHSKLGPGLVESVYKSCLLQELANEGFKVRVEVPMPVVYDGTKLDAGYRIDMLVNESIILEIKAVEAISPVHEAQVLTYLKLSDKRLALLLNFNVALMKDGIRRFIV